MGNLGNIILTDYFNTEMGRQYHEGELAALTGSEKQISWAKEIRLSRLYNPRFIDSIFGTKPIFYENFEEIMNYLQSIRSARWWIETRMLSSEPFLQSVLEECFKARSDDNIMASAVLDEALLAPSQAQGPIAEVSLAAGKVRVVLIEFDKDINTLLKYYGFRWEAPVWTRKAEDAVVEHRAIEIAVRLLAHGCPVRIFDEALRQRTVNHDYEPESPRRVEVSTSEKYSTKFHLVWSRDEKPAQCRAAAQQLRGAKVFDDGAYVAVCHFEEIQDFASLNGFTIMPEAQSLIDAEKGRLAGSVKVAAHPKVVSTIPHKPVLASANGEIDAELLDD